MRYWLLASVSTLSAFALCSIAGSFLAGIAGRLFATRSERLPPRARARLLFRVRILPALTAGVGAFAVALPVFLWFEERDTAEPVNRTLALVAILGAAVLLRGTWRALLAWTSTARVIRDWRRRGRLVGGIAAPMPVLAIDESFPIVAVAGILTPRLFIAERVLRECTPAEVAAMIAHECAHVSARDNVKRLLIRACPDVFGPPRELDRAWTAAAEEAADASAALANPAARLDLAQALIRVARLAAPQAPALASAFYLGGSIDTRVRRLIDPRLDPAPSAWARFVWTASAVLLVATIVAAAPSLHAAMELAVRFLP